MSSRAILHVWELPALDAAERLALLYFADTFADDDRVSVGTLELDDLSRVLGLSDEDVTVLLLRLEHKGLLRRAATYDELLNGPAYQLGIAVGELVQ